MSFTQKQLEFMTYGQWLDIYKSYREIYNFEAKKMLYKDVEDEIEKAKRENQPITSVLDL